MDQDIASMKIAIENLRNEFKMMKETFVTSHQTKSDQQSFAHRLADSVDMIGLKEALTKKFLIVRIIWSILLLLGLGATGVYVRETLMEYLRVPTATNVEMAVDAEYKFPQLVVCYDGWVDQTKITLLNLSADALRYSMGYTSTDKSRIYSLESKTAEESHKEFLEFYASSGFSSIIDFYRSISITPKRQPSILSLEKTEDPSYYCYGCQTDEVKKIFLAGAVCYVFSLSPLKTKSQARYRLLALKMPMTMTALFSTDFSAFRVHFLPNLYLTRPTQLYLTLVSYFHTIVKFSAQKFFSLSKPNEPCLEKQDYPNPDYSVDECIGKCQDDAAFLRLNCRDFWLASERNNPNPENLCNSLDDFSENHTLDIFLNKNIIQEEANKACQDQCPKKCEHEIFDSMIQSQVSLSQVSTYKNISAGAKVQNMSLIIANIIHGAIFTGGVLSYTETNTYPFILFLNNFGGTLGLFVGGAIMTVVQVIMFVVEMIVEKCVRN